MMMMTSMLCLFFLQSLAIASSTIATSSSDGISSSNVIVDNVSDDEHPSIIQLPIIKTAVGGIKLTDSTTHTSSTSSSRKIKDITTNNKQKLDNNNEKGILNSSSRNLNNNDVTTNLWTMNDPTIDYSENEFDGTNRLRLGYTTSDMIDETMFTSTWWTTDCKAGGKKIETTGVGYRFIYTSSTDQLGDGTGTREWYVAFIAAPVLLADADEANSNIYKEYWQDGSKYGMVEVCVRVSLQTPAGIEVNYVENILTIHYYFSDGFYIVDEFNVERPEAEVTGIDMGSTLRAYDCSSMTTGLKSQGMVLRVCIEPMPSAILDGFRMKAIETFSYEKYSTEDPDALPFIQDAVIDSKQVEDQLTLFTCVRGQEQCIIETMLMAIFYQTKGNVEGRGVATMQLGNFAGDDVEGVNRQRSLRSTTPIRKRQLLGGWKSIERRNLQEQESDPEDISQEISIDFEVDKTLDQQQNTASSLSQTTIFHSIGASIGIICLLLFNVFAVAMLVMQFPYFSDTRLYLKQRSMTRT